MGSSTSANPARSYAALDADVIVELIDDGVHVHDGTDPARRTDSPDRRSP